jgi:hypothetical protein
MQCKPTQEFVAEVTAGSIILIALIVVCCCWCCKCCCFKRRSPNPALKDNLIAVVPPPVGQQAYAAIPIAQAHVPAQQQQQQPGYAPQAKYEAPAHVDGV